MMIVLYARVPYIILLVAFSCRRIFTPFREHVTSCRRSYRLSKRARQCPAYIYISMSVQWPLWSVDWRYFTCKQKALHLPGCHSRGDSKFSKLPTPDQDLIFDSPLSSFRSLHSSLFGQSRTKSRKSTLITIRTSTTSKTDFFKYYNYLFV